MSEFTGKHTRQEFLQRLQDNGWVIRSGNYSDLDELERLYDYAEENDGDWLDELMAKVFETEVKTAESREEMRDAISQAGFDHDADELVFIEAYLKRNVSTEQIRQGFERIEQEKKEAQDKERRAQEDARESAYREEQNRFVSNVKARGWVLTNDEFRTLHRAGRNLPEDSPFRQKLKSMEAGNMHLVPGMTLTPQFEFQEWALRTELLSLKNSLQKLPKEQVSEDTNKALEFLKREIGWLEKDALEQRQDAISYKRLRAMTKERVDRVQGFAEQIEQRAAQEQLPPSRERDELLWNMRNLRRMKMHGDQTFQKGWRVDFHYLKDLDRSIERYLEAAEIGDPLADLIQKTADEIKTNGSYIPLFSKKMECLQPVDIASPAFGEKTLKERVTFNRWPQKKLSEDPKDERTDNDEVLNAILAAYKAHKSAGSNRMDAVMNELANTKLDRTCPSYSCDKLLEKIDAAADRQIAGDALHTAIEKRRQQIRESEAYAKDLRTIEKQRLHNDFIAAREQFVNDAQQRGWACDADTLRKIYDASEGLRPDKEYVRILEDIRMGRTGEYTAIPLSADGELRPLQTNEVFGRALDALREEMVSQEVKENAKAALQQVVDSTADAARQQRESYPAYEMRERIDGEDFDLHRRQMCIVLGINIADESNRRMLHDINTVDSFKSGGQNAPAAADALAAMNRLKQSIPAYVRDLQANDPRRIHAIALLENFSPDTARALSDEIRTGNARQFNNDPAVDVGNDFLAGLDGNVEEQKRLFANLANNLEATGRSYFNHRNTPDYDRMLTALKCAAGAKTPCAFEEAKRQIARTSEDYLRGKPDLGTASSFHPKSELRRKCAYLAVAIADPEAGKALAIESDRFRRGDDRIRFGRLAAMPGVGTVNAQVRNIRVEDIAAGNQQNNNGNDRRRIEQGADHRRNLAAHQRQNNDQNGPVAGGSNNH